MKTDLTLREAVSGNQTYGEGGDSRRPSWRDGNPDGQSFAQENAMIATDIKTLSLFVNGRAVASESGRYADIFDPSTGQAVANALCAQEEVDGAIEAAKNAYPAWAGTPAIKRFQVLYKFGTSSTRTSTSSPGWCAWKTARSGKRRAATS